MERRYRATATQSWKIEAADSCRRSFTNLREKLTDVLSMKKIVAVGETGLDYHYDNSPRASQVETFAKQIEIARERNLPLVVHERESFDACASLLKETSGMKVIIHCFSGGREHLERWLDMGFYISFSGTVTFKKAEYLREALKMVPDDRILFETDCPYLAPQPVRGKRNEPAFIKYIYETAAVVRGTAFAELEEKVRKNVRNIFFAKPLNSSEFKG